MTQATPPATDHYHEATLTYVVAEAGNLHSLVTSLHKTKPEKLPGELRKGIRLCRILSETLKNLK